MPNNSESYLVEVVCPCGETDTVPYDYFTKAWRCDKCSAKQREYERADLAF